MPELRRFDSDTTHVSDSEPEREEIRSRARKLAARVNSTNTSSVHRVRKPFADNFNAQKAGASTNIEPYFGVETRLMHVESEIGRLKAELRAMLKGVLWAHSSIFSG